MGTFVRPNYRLTVLHNVLPLIGKGHLESAPGVPVRDVSPRCFGGVFMHALDLLQVLCD